MVYLHIKVVYAGKFNICDSSLDINYRLKLNYVKSTSFTDDGPPELAQTLRLKFQNFKLPIPSYNYVIWNSMLST